MTAALDAIRAMSEEAASYKDTVYVKRAHKAVRYLLAALDRAEAVERARLEVAVKGLTVYRGLRKRIVLDRADVLGVFVPPTAALRAYEDADKVADGDGFVVGVAPKVHIAPDHDAMRGHDGLVRCALDGELWPCRAALEDRDA